MSKLEKRIINNDVFFVVLEDYTNKIQDFYIFSEKGWMPTLEDYAFKCMSDIIEQDINSDGKYSKKYFKKMCQVLYRIDLLSNRRIDLSSCEYLREYKKNALENEYFNVANTLSCRLTFEGIKATLQKAMGIPLNNSEYFELEDKIENKLTGFKSPDLRRELKHFCLLEAYEKGKSNALTFTHAYEKKEMTKKMRELIEESVGDELDVEKEKNN